MTFAVSAAVAGFGMTVVSAVGSAQMGKINGAASIRGQIAQKALNKAETETSNAQSNTARALQVINNNRALRVGGKHFDAASQNRVRSADAFVRGSIEQQIQQAEQNGAYAANLASKGVGGASADAIQGTLLLQQSRQRGAAKATQDYLTYDQAKEQAGIMPSTMNSLDMTVFSGSVDNTVVLPPIQQGTDYAGLAASLLNSKLASAIPDMYAKYSSTSLTAPAYQQQGFNFSRRTGLEGIRIR